MPRLEDWEIKKYWEIFQGLKPVDNKLGGDAVSPALKNSRLPDETLSKIWTLSDIDRDSKLDFEEFCITMRLIFDMVNGNITLIPDNLPNWLIPASKSQYIASNNHESDDELSDDFDWYISPTDKSTYESIYNTNSDSYGYIKFDSLDPLYKTLTHVSKSDISLAWNLVNPKSFETIDKDQVLVFLHMLNQRENGKRVPRSVPPSLRATFSKEAPNYDLNAQPTSKLNYGTSNSNVSSSKGFANDYISKINSNPNNEKGTDFSATEGTDWEIVRLKRELADLEENLSTAQKKTPLSSSPSNELVTKKYDFEQLLKYKQQIYQDLKSGQNNDVKNVLTEIDLIESQVTTLTQYLLDKTNELEKLNKELASYS